MWVLVSNLSISRHLNLITIYTAIITTFIAVIEIVIIIKWALNLKKSIQNLTATLI